MQNSESLPGGADLILLLVGDTNLQHRADPTTAFTHVKPLLDAADVRFANLEGPLSTPSEDPGAPDIPHKVGWRHSDPRMVAGLVDARFDAVGCANNVTYPPRALLESLAVLDAHGIHHCGGGHNEAEARRPAIVERLGVRFGFLGYTSVFWPFGHAAGPEAPGVATIKAHTAYRPHPRAHEMPGGPPTVVTWADPDQLAAMQADVRVLRRHVDIVTVSCHWGVSGSTETLDYQREIGRAAVEAGADVVIGHGPHALQGIEVFDGPDGRRPVFYSLGNFAFDWTKMRGRHLEGLLVRCRVRHGKLSAVSFVPVQKDDANDPRPAGPAAAAGRQILQTVLAFSLPFGTTLEPCDDEIAVALNHKATIP